MKRLVLSLWVCFAAYCGSQSNTAPLAFGMTPDEAEAALGVPLVLYSSHHRSEIYVARDTAYVPGAFRSFQAVALQFRKGHLTGWKRDWAMRRPTW